MTILDQRPIFADVSPAARGTVPPEAPARDWTWTNWALSLSTAPAAVLLMAFALARVAGSALCSTAACPSTEADGALFGLLYHGPVAIAALTLFLAFFFATRRAGVLVWLGGWLLLLADLTVLVLVF